MATALRPAAAGDLTSVLSALREGYSEAGEPFDLARAAVWLQDLVSASFERVWLIERNGKIAGFALLHHAAASSPVAYVSGLYVTPDERGTGLGPMALGLLRDVCRLAGTRLLEHQVEQENKLPRIPVRLHELAA